MISTEKMAELSSILEHTVELTKKVYATAPDIIPPQLDAFAFIEQDQVMAKLTNMFAVIPENEQEGTYLAFLQTANKFVAAITEMENKIKARLQPDNVPRREGSRPIKQFKTRKGEW